MEMKIPPCMKSLPGSLCLLVFALMAGSGACAGELALAEAGRSAYGIYMEKDAPESVKDAAAELQKYIEISTGAKLPLVSQPQEKMIALGNSAAATAAGIAADIPEEGFRIKTVGPAIYIVGNDAMVPGGGRSEGTYYGVMEFLERFVGVRWLLPTFDGDDVPRHAGLTIPDADISDAPAFHSRIGLSFWTGTDAEGKRMNNDLWSRRMRLAQEGREPVRQPMVLDYNHAWEMYGMPEALMNRPDLMALVNGKRTAVKTARDLVTMKYATTNPELIDLFSSKVSEAMDKAPGKRMWAISPSDGHGWCESPEAVALDEQTDPDVWPGNKMYGNKSLTPRVLTFFNAVAKQVAKKHPDKILGAFAYAGYTYPPSHPPEIEPNLFFMLAVRAYYGYSLYNPTLAAEFPRLVEAWGKMLPGRIGWFDYSTWVGLNKINVGAPYPPGIPLMKMIYPALKANNYKAVFVDDSAPQGYGGLYAYLAAKMLWNPNADLDALANDWLQRAYGSGWPSMRKLYDLLDEKVAAYKKNRQFDSQYRCVPEQVKEIHLPIFGEMERLYLAALAGAETDAQFRRLKMFGDNLVLLHWNMRKADWLSEPEKSVFYRSDRDFEKFINENYNQPAFTKRPGEEERLRFLQPQLGLSKEIENSVHD